MRTNRILALGAVTTLMAAVVPATAASATTIRCGDTITTDVVLSQNLTCPGDGLWVETDGTVTIDLNGYRLTGSGSGTGIGLTWEYASGDVTVRNGTIRNFAKGVEGSGMTGRTIRLEQLKLLNNEVGATGDDHYVVTGSTFKGSRTAIGGTFNIHLRVTVSASTFDSNDTGIDANSTEGASVSNSTFLRNRRAINCADTGLAVDHSHFVGNAVSIDALLCSVDFRDNRVAGGDVGVHVSDSGYWSGLKAERNSFVGAGIGLLLDGFTSATIADNYFKDNAASGLVIEENPDTYMPRTSVAVTGNKFVDNGYNPGTYTDPAGNPLTSGVWTNTGPSTVFTGNRAVSNAGHGIDAGGVTDGGGNRASLNLTEPQCIGVVCVP